MSKELSTNGNSFGFNGVTTLDLSEEVTVVDQTLKKDVKTINMPKVKSKWDNNPPETRIYDFKRMDMTLVVTGVLVGSNAQTKKNQLIAFMEQGGVMGSVSWNDETLSSADEVGGMWLVNAKFTDEETEKDLADLADDEVKYDFSLTIIRAVER